MSEAAEASEARPQDARHNECREIHIHNNFDCKEIVSAIKQGNKLFLTELRNINTGLNNINETLLKLIPKPTVATKGTIVSATTEINN